MPQKTRNKTKNPFTDKFVKEECKWYGLEPYRSKSGRIEVHIAKIHGRLDDFLNVNYRLEKLKCPVLKIDGKVWMSLTPMEIQSSWVPIQTAYGDVATAGLGLGYFVLRAAEKPEVRSIDVYEIDEEIIKYFNERFSSRAGFEKIRIIHGDVRELMIGKRYSFVFMDPYQTILPDEVINDCNLFNRKNRIWKYHFWGQEKVFAQAVERGRRVSFTSKEIQLIKYWERTKLSRLRDVYLDDDFINKVLEVMCRDMEMYEEENVS